MPRIFQAGVVAQIDTIDDQISEAIGAAITFLPRLVGAIIILLIGWIIGRILGSLVTRFADGVELDRMVLDTPLGKILGGTERAVSKAFGTLARWFIYALAILAAADVLAIAVLSEWIERAVSYLPAFVAGLLIIIFGFIVADFIGDVIRRTQAATHTRYTKWFATGVRMFLYFVAVVVGLDTMGIDVEILYVFARALAWGLAVAVALGAGLAFGFGAQDYVRENVDRWMRSGKSKVQSGDGSDSGHRSDSERSGSRDSTDRGDSSDRDDTRDSTDREDSSDRDDTRDSTDREDSSDRDDTSDSTDREGSRDRGDTSDSMDRDDTRDSRDRDDSSGTDLG